MKTTVVWLVSVALLFTSLAYGGSPYGTRRDDGERRRNPASMEGLLFFEEAETVK